MKSISMLLVLVAGCLFLSSVSAQNIPPVADHTLTVILENGHRVLNVDGLRIKENELSRYFAASKSKGKIRETSIQVILAPRLGLKDFFEVRGMLHMIGFIEAKFYVSSDDSTQVVEIGTLGQAMPAPSK